MYNSTWTYYTYITLYYRNFKRHLHLSQQWYNVHAGASFIWGGWGRPPKKKEKRKKEKKRKKRKKERKKRTMNNVKYYYAVFPIFQ